jgi:dihydropteroate synthase
MIDDGADILDLGGESTRPNSTPVTPAEEQARVLPILRAILTARTDAVVSIDTYRAETARLAIDCGAEIVNDVSGFLWDDAMAATCASLACGVVLMHTRGRPQEWSTLPALAHGEVLPLVLRELRVRTDAALAAGIRRDAIVLDPGFGFGKILDENFPLLASLDAIHALGFPLLVGLSRKSFLRCAFAERSSTGPTDKSGAPEPALSLPKGLDSETWVPTAAATTAAILAGAHILRVHDVRPAREAAAIADRILAAAST